MMKDLDFDEIDRAVKLANPGSSVVSEGVATPVNTVTEPTQVASQTSPTIINQQRSSRSGRFMDVVHPSSNMRRTPLTISKPEPEPKNDSKPPETSPPALKSTPESTPIPTLPLTLTPSQVQSLPAEANNWPDPIDYRGNQINTTDNTTTNQDQKGDTDIDKISNDITSQLNQKSAEPLESPFISGTKVDKRPLGAFSTEPEDQEVAKETEQILEQADVQENIDDLKEKETPTGKEKPAVIDTSLPEELQGDLLSIESGDSSTNSDKSNAAKALVNTVNPHENQTQSVAPNSISQQYKEQPSSGDQDTGAIYDTDSYHKSLVHPYKKKSGWSWVVLTIILIILGVGAGIAVYKYVLPIL